MKDSPTWSDPVWVAAVMALQAASPDNGAYDGVCLKGPAGPGRDAWLGLVRDLLPPEIPIRRCPSSIDTERLLGGLNLTASLIAGSSVLQRGLLSETDGGIVVFAMAECLPTGIGAQIASAYDQGFVRIARDGVEAELPSHFGFILLDEGQDDDERAPDALAQRCAFQLATASLPVALSDNDKPAASQIATAYAQLQTCAPIDETMITALCEAALAFGIASLRPVLAALRACAAIAALKGRTDVTLEEVSLAARLVFAPIATAWPASPQDESQQETPESEGDDSHPNDSRSQQHNEPSAEPEEADRPASSDTPPADMLIETIKAALPEGVIAALMAARVGPRKARDRDGRGSGEAVQSAKRGRPIGSRRGSLRSGARLHVIDTLRAAAPWQKLRQQQSGLQRVHVRPEDIRLRRFIEKRETTIIFVVDASGSSAWQRLAEAKGAVQMMLSHAYQTRSRVALVAFRKDGAELVLPPTRSLTRARRTLADMVGGGGTPLAHGLELALGLALSERKKGRTPRLLLLTDGQANIARDGTPGRPQANADAHAAGRQIGAFNISAVHIDTAVRPRPGSGELASHMRAIYAPLPNPRSGDLTRMAGLAG